MTQAKVVDRYFPTTGSTKYSVRILRTDDEPEGWLSDNNIWTGSRSEARVFNTSEQAAEVARGLSYEIVK